MGNIAGSSIGSIPALGDRASLRLKAIVTEMNGRPATDADLEAWEKRPDNNGIRFENELRMAAILKDPYYADLVMKAAPVSEAIVTTLFSFGAGQATRLRRRLIGLEQGRRHPAIHFARRFFVIC